MEGEGERWEFGRRGETSGGNEYCSRTRSVWRERTWRRERTADVRTWIYADVWRERETENDRGKKRAAERERESRRERATWEKEVRGRRRRERESGMASIHWKERGVEVQENRLLAEGAEGSTRGQDTRRMRGGRGNARSRSDSVPSFSFAPFAQPFSAFLPSCFLPRVPPLLLSSFHARVARVLSLHSPIRLSLSLSLSPCPIAGVWARIPDHGRARTIQGPAGMELFVQGCSISGWSLMQIENGLVARRNRRATIRSFRRSCVQF